MNKLKNKSTISESENKSVKEILTSDNNQHDIFDYTGKMKSLFAPFNHFGMADHSTIPLDKVIKPVSENPKKHDHEDHHANKITNPLVEAYSKQIELSLDLTKKIHHEFTNQLANIYNFNQQFLSTIFNTSKINNKPS